MLLAYTSNMLNRRIGGPYRGIQDCNGRGSNIGHKLFEISRETELEGTDTSYIKEYWDPREEIFSVQGW